MKVFNLIMAEDSQEDIVMIERCVQKINTKFQDITIKVVSCNDIKGLEDKLSEENFDLILLDLSLPDSSGLSTVKHVVKKFDTPIVVLTGNVEMSIAIKAIDYGVQDFLNKNELSPYLLSRSVIYAIERHNILKKIEVMRIDQVRSLKMATLGETAAKIAHEVNNPLTIILGYADKILRLQKKGSLNGKELQEIIQKITLTTERISKVIKGLKAFSRIDEEVAPFQSFSLSQILDEAFVMCQEKFDIAGIKISTNVSKDIFLKCREFQIIQVFLNLLNNSYDFLSENRLEASYVNIYIDTKLDEENLINIIYEDSGIVKDHLVRSKILQSRFTTKGKDQGTGLGLSISQEIIKEHGGSITLENKENTTFRISLPPAIG